MLKDGFYALVCTRQPFELDMTIVIVCFSTPVSSTFSPAGRLISGNSCKIRTTAYAASVSAKSTINNQYFVDLAMNEHSKLTT
jgi:hypothetical protein